MKAGEIPVIAIFDVGKTNKKLFLFNESYEIVYEKSARFTETIDEDGYPCENVDSLRLSIFDSLSEVFRLKEFTVKAVNFSSYGASLVYIGEDGSPVSPLYNYLKPYPENLSAEFYKKYGGEEQFSIDTASPALGSLNSGLQLYRLLREQPEIFKKVKYALHLPQYLSYLLSGRVATDITSVGCHTGLWDFKENRYHEWVQSEGVATKLAPLSPANRTGPSIFSGNFIKVGIGLHDSSAALIPYMVNFTEPFILISTGTWCISLNPFNHEPLTAEELMNDCLCYLQYEGKPVKASRVFSGHRHEEQVKRIALQFGMDIIKYRNVRFDSDLIDKTQFTDFVNSKLLTSDSTFADRDLSTFKNDIEAYHYIVADLIRTQKRSTDLVLKGTDVKRIFVDGGFGKNSVFMNLLTIAYPQIEIFAASMPQSTALGAAIAIRHQWNKVRLPSNLIELNYYVNTAEMSEE